MGRLFFPQKLKLVEKLHLKFQKHLNDESALSRFEVRTKPIYKCNKDCPFYATQCQDIFIQYREGFNFVSGKLSLEFDGIHLTVP